MESDDEATDPTWNSHPFLRLFEDEECDLRALQKRDSVPSLYVALRFFGTIKGFHAVSASTFHCWIWKD